MSETTTPAVQVVTAPQTVTRNDIPLEIKEHKILKGKRADSVYLAPEVTVENLPTVLKWIGDASLMNEIASSLKKRFQSIWFNAVDDATGQVNMERFLVDAANFTTSGMKLKEISDKLDELQASLAKIIMSGGWQSTSPEAVVKQTQMEDINKQILAYMAMKEDRQRKPKTEEEAEPAVTV